MNTLKSSYAVALGIGLLALGSACSVEAGSSEFEPAVTGEQALCANQDGVNAYMAALGTATAREVGRWLPSRDFQWNTSTNKLELSYYGKKRCADGKCFNVQELLNMQVSAANNLVVFPGGDRLNTDALNSRLKANWDRQITCNNRPDNHLGDDCPVEYHQLAMKSVTAGACDKLFSFKATATDGVTALTEPGQLKNQLLWVGYNTDPNVTNPYLAFQSTASTVSIDPTVGLTEGDATSSGSCAAACTMVSSTSVIGECCSCNGVTKTFTRSPFSYNTYLCR